MDLDVFLLYLAAWTLLALSPGPAVFFTMGLAARHGMRGAVAGTVGIGIAHVVVFAAIAFGLLALLASFSGAMTALRIAGALYLMYLGGRMLMSKRGETPVADPMPQPPAHGGLILQGILVQLTNPKLLLFMLALLPQFIRPDHPLLLQLAIMMTVTIVIDAIALLAYANLAAHGARALKGSRIITWIERVFGGALILFGVKLLLDKR
jgi:homoserine/homoserine lactone efflux protein